MKKKYNTINDYIIAYTLDLELKLLKLGSVH